MASFARPLAAEDLDILSPIDAAYAARFELEPIATRSSISFFVRSGHAFVAVTDGAVTGFALAQAVWNGTRPAVYLSRLAVMDSGDMPSRLALLEAVTKSAYDAAVYDIQVLIPETDAGGLEALGDKQYSHKRLLVFERMLGSRGAAGREE